METKTWPEAIHHGLMSGAAASVLSTAALSVLGKMEAGDVHAPTNAISHWIWGDVAASKNGFQSKYTIPGYVIHHASAVFWAVLLERYYGQALDKSNHARILEAAGATAAIACFTDYKLTPHRLQPGFEMRLSKPSLLLVYASFAIGLAWGVHAIRQKRMHSSKK
ncbi:hypothetical protein [Methylophilus methylotrophus]|uniref:hypothetical protein n=1 Tax=Methylophilus methylotrophus TaxID=17 RepID=UPI00037DEA93|nr:hypothetical protein [Methylophilus methylotrophus]